MSERVLMIDDDAALALSNSFQNHGSIAKHFSLTGTCRVAARRQCLWLRFEFQHPAAAFRRQA